MIITITVINLFVCERQPFEDLVQELTRKCTCGSVAWALSRYDQVLSFNY